MDITSILESILSDKDLKGRSCLMLDVQSQTQNTNNLTTTKIEVLADSLRELRPQEVRVYTRMSQKLTILLNVYYKYSHLLNTSLSDLKTLLEFAPWGDMLEVIERYGEFYRFHQLESEQLSYICGIMLQDVSPEYHEKFHRENMERLSQLKLEGLLDFCRRIHVNILSNLAYANFLNPAVSLEEHMGNTTDNLGDKLCDYFPFDVIYYLDEDRKIYGITRTEFDYILEKRENPYTRRGVPPWVLAEVQKRNNISLIACLGPCQTIECTWQSLLYPKLKYEELISRVKVITNNSHSISMPIFTLDRKPSEILDELARYHSRVKLRMIQPESSPVENNSRESRQDGYWTGSPVQNRSAHSDQYRSINLFHPLSDILSSLTT